MNRFVKSKSKVKCELTVLATALGVLTMAGAERSSAGNLEEPVAVPTVIATEQTELDLSGFYLGGSLAYGLGISDDVGHRGPDGALVATPGRVDPDGFNYGVRVGWRNNINVGRVDYVYGVELGYDIAEIEDSFTTAAYSASSEIENVLSLKYKGGITNARKNTLFYGTLGYIYADVDYDVVGASGGSSIALNGSDKRGGLVYGLGVERAISDSVSVLFEWEYNYIDSFSLNDGAGASTIATPSYNNFRLGMNYSF